MTDDKKPKKKIYKFLLIFLIVVIISSVIVIKNKKYIYINEAYIDPPLIKEGSQFNLFFEIVNKYEHVVGNINYEFLYDNRCFENQFNDNGTIRIHPNRDSEHQSFYTKFKVKENISDYCMKNSQPFVIIIKNSKENLDYKKIQIQIAIPTNRVKEIMVK